jgi:hypothetical protein
MGSSDIEKYISKNQTDVDRWMTLLFSLHAKNLISPETSKMIRSNEVESDARRSGKFIEVARHLKAITRAEYVNTPYSRYKTQESYCLLTVNQDTFESLAPKYAKEQDFVLLGKGHKAADDKSVNRVDWYPTIKQVTPATLIHYFFNRDLYSTYEIEEQYNVGNSFSPKKDVRKLIKIYPKRLEGGAEQEMFRRALDRYYDKNVDRAIELLYGYKTKVLSNLPEKSAYNDLQETTPKNMGVRRINTLPLKKLCVSELKQMLPEAMMLQQYANGLVEDLLALIPIVGESNEEIVNDVMEKAPADLMLKAPLMMTSMWGLEREIADMLLRGSNKGIV